MPEPTDTSAMRAREAAADNALAFLERIEDNATFDLEQFKVEAAAARDPALIKRFNTFAEKVEKIRAALNT